MGLLGTFRIAERTTALARVRGTIASVASQSVGLLQLAALLWKAPIGLSTDAYFYLFPLGLMPTAVLIVGVVYPLLLNQASLTKSAARGFAITTPALSIGAVFSGSIWLTYNGKLSSDLVAFVVLLSANAGLQCPIYLRAVLAESEGEALWISGLAFPANLLATFFLLFSPHEPATAVTVMTLGLVLGNLVLLCLMIRWRIGEAARQALPSTGARISDFAWFGTKSAVGYGSIALVQTLAVLLPASSNTIFGLASKLVSAVSTTFVNTLMPRLVNRSTSDFSSARYFIRVLLVILTAIGAVGLAVSAVIGGASAPFLVVLCLATWLPLSASAAAVQRSAFRFLPSSASITSMVSVLLVGLLAGISSTSQSFSIVVLLCALALMDGLNASALLLALRDFRATIAALTLSLILSMVWLSELL